MGVTLLQKVKPTPVTTSVSTFTFTTTADIHPGEDIFIAMGAAAGAGLSGVNNISVNAGAGTFERCATAVRASTLDITLARFRVTTLIPSGSIVTWTGTSANTRHAPIMQVVSGLTSAAAHMSSGVASQGVVGTTSNGPNGSSTSASASTSAATTIPDCLILGIVGEGGTNTFVAGSGCSMIDENRTTVGTSDRGVGLMYKVVSATGVQTASASVTPSGSWAAAVAAFEIDVTAPAAPVAKEWDGDSWNELVAKEWDGDSWNVIDWSEL